MAGQKEWDGIEWITGGVPRPVRVLFPVRVSFSGETFVLEEFSANLSAGGLFLPTSRVIPPGTRGTLTFRISRWEPPFTLQAEVARAVPPDPETVDHPPGMGIRFVNLDAVDMERLERLVAGIRDGSVTQAIRRTLRQENKTLDRELRRRTTDQKVIFSVSATGDEIEALIRDGHPAVILRLFQNPNLVVRHVRLLLRDPSLPPRVLAAVKRSSRWLVDDETRLRYCGHPGLPLQEALSVLPSLSRASLQTLAANTNLRGQLAARVRQLLHRAASPRVQ